MSPIEWIPDPNRMDDSWPDDTLVSVEIVLLGALVLIVLVFLAVVAIKAMGGFA